MEPKGFHQRGYLPHCDHAGSFQAITFRERRSLPASVVEKWKASLRAGLESTEPGKRKSAHQQLMVKIAKYEDAGHGPCRLADPGCAAIVQNYLLSGHGQSYELIAWCIMPNHVHALIRQFEGESLGAIVRSWKGASARQINQALKRTGGFWSRDYHDRGIRDLEHYRSAIAYIHSNPVRAGLVTDAREWAFSSLGYGWGF